jgi:acyl-CoA reductase-like NAD-dependent aldehyde dehydrogenase
MPARPRKPKRLPRSLPPAVTVSDLAEAVAALTAAQAVGRPVALLSPPEAALWLGPGWLVALAAEAAKAVPGARAFTILDCADRPDLAQAALRQGADAIVFTGSQRVAAKLADIARAYGAAFFTKRPQALELAGETDAAAALRHWLGAD